MCVTHWDWKTLSNSKIPQLSDGELGLPWALDLEPRSFAVLHCPNVCVMKIGKSLIQCIYKIWPLESLASLLVFGSDVWDKRSLPLPVRSSIQRAFVEPRQRIQWVLSQSSCNRIGPFIRWVECGEDEHLQGCHCQSPPAPASPSVQTILGHIEEEKVTLISWGPGLSSVSFPSLLCALSLLQRQAGTERVQAQMSVPIGMTHRPALLP